MAQHPFQGVTFKDVTRYDKRTLDVVMQHGATPKGEDLAGWEFRGFNPPVMAKVLGFQKFMKGFFLERGQLAGYNLFVKNPRGGIERPWRATKGGGTEARHGFYDVKPVTPGDRYDEFPNAVFLDYGSGRNSRLNPESQIRDYLVQVDPSNPDIFLGKAYIELGPVSVFSNFFVLERIHEAPN